jgi:cyclic pyranopterin phosphate synthase
MPLAEVSSYPRNEILSYEEIAKIAKACIGLGINKFRLTGGEPLLRKGLETLVQNLSRLEGVEDLSLTTNGMLFPQQGKALAEAGLQRINISLDTLNPDKFKKLTRGGAFEAVMEGIELALQLKLNPVKINIVVIRGFNEDELDNIIQWAAGKPIILRFIEFMPNSSTLDTSWGPEKVITAKEIRERCLSLRTLEPNYEGVHGYGPAEYWRIPSSETIIGFISPLSKSCFCQKCRRLRLTADGHLQLCLHHDIQIDLKTPLRGGADTADIARIIQTGILRKPEAHHLNEDYHQCLSDPMSRIGG